MDRETARNLLLSYPLSTERVDTPWWPEFSQTDEADNRLLVRELSGDEALEFENETDKKKAIGQVIVKALLLPDTKQPVFNELDFQAVIKQLGNAKLTPIFRQIMMLSNMMRQGDQAVADAKKN